MAIPCIRYLKTPSQQSSVYDYFLYTIPQDTFTTVHCLLLCPVNDTSRHPYNSSLFMAIPCIRYLKTPLQPSSVYGYFLYTIPQDTLTTVLCLWLFPVYDTSRHPYNSPLFMQFHVYDISRHPYNSPLFMQFPVYNTSRHPYNSPLFMAISCI